MTGEGLLRCAAGDREFAIRAPEVRHVARADQLRPHDEQDGRVGALTLGGQHVPVFALRKVLGLPDEERRHGDQHIAVTGEGHELVGWLVDRITREPATVSPPIAALPAFVGGDARRWFDGVVTCVDQRTLLLLNPQHLNPLRTASDPDDDEPEPFISPTGVAGPRSEPVALVFSTPVLPASATDRYALTGREVAAIVQPGEELAIPGCAAHIAGFTLWRDVVVPILDFRQEPRTNEAHRRRLVARCGPAAKHALLAFAIDGDVVMHRPGSDNRLLPATPCPPFANGVFDVDGDQVALLDLDALVAGAAEDFGIGIPYFRIF